MAVCVHYVPTRKNVKVISTRHAVSGEIIIRRCPPEGNEFSAHWEYDPHIVVNTYFEPCFIERYGFGSREILHEGTNYVDALDLRYGRRHRLQYYEYGILVDDVRLLRLFRERYPADTAFLDRPDVQHYLSLAKSY